MNIKVSAQSPVMPDVLTVEGVSGDLTSHGLWCKVRDHLLA